MTVQAHDLVDVPGGTFAMGSADFYPEERPVRAVAVEPFRLTRGPITNGQFGAFIEATGHITAAEQPPDQRRFPGAPAGSLVFTPTAGPVNVRDATQWWRFVPGACWRAPGGPGTDIAGLADHPVVHVALADAVAYAAWAGLRLPTEAEWERAARGGLEAATYAWGAELTPRGARMANTWQGRFPWENTAVDGYERTSPVGAFPPNGFGLVDMIGNVWEWTRDPFLAAGEEPVARCCAPPVTAQTSDPYVVKGGSHLCAPNYCRRYRPAARSPETADTSTSHIGFRCAADG